MNSAVQPFDYQLCEKPTEAVAVGDLESKASFISTLSLSSYLIRRAVKGGLTLLGMGSTTMTRDVVQQPHMANESITIIMSAKTNDIDLTILVFL